jgi:hypothetical protein
MNLLMRIQRIRTAELFATAGEIAFIRTIVRVKTDVNKDLVTMTEDVIGTVTALP